MKVAICTPVHSDPKWHYTVSLANLLTQTRGVDLGYFATQGTSVARRRNELARSALDAGADWLFWLDADHSFPPDALARLLAHKQEFVGCNYARRDDPAGPTAGRIGSNARVDYIWTTQEDADAGKLEPVHVLGFGCCLVSRSVFERVEEPWFRGEGEDYDFCARAIIAGFSIYLDHGLSWEIGHVRESLVTNAHAVADRARWLPAASGV